MIPSVSLQDLKSVYFLGIGGIGMSALARWFMFNGIIVEGYDKTPTSLTKTLENEGMKIHFEDSIDFIPKEIFERPQEHLVIYTPAIPSNHIEKNYLIEKGIQIYKRSEILGWITREIPTLAVGGTHGKTTTSSLLSHILKFNKVNVTAFLGGITQNYQSNFIANEGKENIVGVVEADEYDRSFLRLYPKHIAIMSTDPDHLDIYGENEQVLKSFQEFVGNIQEGGILAYRDGLDLPYSGKKISFGINQGMHQAKNIRIENHKMTYDWHFENQIVKGIKLQNPGYHNIENALAAGILAMTQGLNAEQIKDGIESFKGVKRRFEYIIESPKIIYIDDYAHHPTEIETFLKSVKSLYPEKKLTAVFQPHLFSRTKDFAEGFATSLSLADELYLLEIYPARELPIPGIDSEWLFNKINLKNKFLEKKENIVEKLIQNQPELLVTIGAGDIDTIIEPLKLNLE
ncbi:MAG: UDP-N-acetylmuramate--L-alanine ligase [Bacteroidota bacterium]|jgi:UDP-N-acetylmuramate--alanine ligase